MVRRGTKSAWKASSMMILAFARSQQSERARLENVEAQRARGPLKVIGPKSSQPVFLNSRSRNPRGAGSGSGSDCSNNWLAGFGPHSPGGGGGAVIQRTSAAGGGGGAAAAGEGGRGPLRVDGTRVGRRGNFRTFQETLYFDVTIFFDFFLV